jgi:hypothetical protein
MKKTPFNRKNRKQLKNEISYLNWENEHRKNEYLVHQRWQSYRINQLKIENNSLNEQCINLQHECIKESTQLLLDKDQVLIEFYKIQNKCKFWKYWALFWCLMSLTFILTIIFGTFATII